MARPHTHIFNSRSGSWATTADMRTSVENEWLCARIVRLWHPVASARSAIGSTKTLIVERFDRTLHSSGKFWLRIMQEDFCQPRVRRGIASTSRRRTGLTEIARILRGSAQSQADLKPCSAARYCSDAGRTDGHAKNFSIRILAAARSNSPAVRRVVRWPVIGKKANEIPIEKVALAMALPGQALLSSKEHQRRHFETLASAWASMPTRAAHDEMAARTPKVIEEVQRNLQRAIPGSARPVWAGSNDHESTREHDRYVETHFSREILSRFSWFCRFYVQGNNQ